MKKLYRNCKYIIEYFFFIIFVSLLRLLPITKSACICAFIVSRIGPRLSATKIARKNLRLIYKDIDAAQEEKIINGMWDNFGRLIGEFPHFSHMTSSEILKRVEIEGLGNIEQFKESKQPFLIFSGHFANWEFFPHIADVFYPKLATVYRKANNPFVDEAIAKLRQRDNVSFIPKGLYGAKALVRSLKEKRSIAMLVDQKMNDGISVPFMGAQAMTAPAIAKFALQFNYPIIPFQIIRKENSTFKMIIGSAMNIPSDGSETQKIYNIMVEVNQILESWINENPDQWFWMHNRWS